MLRLLADACFYDVGLMDYSKFLDDEFDAKAWVNNAFRTNKESSNDVTTYIHTFVQ